MKFFVDKQGKYLGAWDDASLKTDARPPLGAVEVPAPPIDARQIWTGPAWGEAPATEEQFQQAMQQHMDEAAKAVGYDNISTAVTYADESAVAKFQQEGLAFRAWRSRVWAYGYQELAKVKGGQRPVPSIAGFIAELPKLVLP